MPPEQATSDITALNLPPPASTFAQQAVLQKVFRLRAMRPPPPPPPEKHARLNAYAARPTVRQLTPPPSEEDDFSDHSPLRALVNDASCSPAYFDILASEEVNLTDSVSHDDPSSEDRKYIREAKTLLWSVVASSHHLNLYRLSRLIGYGTFGSVLEAMTVDGSEVAIKICRKAAVNSSRLSVDPVTKLTVPLEFSIQQHALPNHPAFMPVLDTWQDDVAWYLVTPVGGWIWTPERVQWVRSHFGKLHHCTPDLVKKSNRLSTASSTLSHGHICWRIPALDSVDQFIDVPQRGNRHSLAGFVRASAALVGKFAYGEGNSSTTPKSANKRSVDPIVDDKIGRRLVRNIAEALKQLHARGIVHRDIKDENILVAQDLSVQLIDFGHAAFYRSSETNPFIAPFRAYGTPLFAAPEVRSGMTFSGPEGDMFALGLVIYEMHYGDLPEGLEHSRYVMRGECPFDLSNRRGFKNALARDLCSRLLVVDPEIRLTIDQVLAHPWLAN